MTKRPIRAVAFDLDGTLYPNRRFYVRLIPFLLKHHRLLAAMGKARNWMREEGHGSSFFEEQSRIMASILGRDPAQVHEETETLIYRGWEPLFKGLELFPHVRETLDSLSDAGLPLGLLSDFPPDTKLRYMELDSYFPVVLGSEACGRLKPDPLPFNTLASALGFDPGEILYVGNSISYDVKGARGAGMQTALVAGRLSRAFNPRIRRCGADFIFSDYRQLKKFVVG